MNSSMARETSLMQALPVITHSFIFLRNKKLSVPCIPTFCIVYLSITIKTIHYHHVQVFGRPRFRPFVQFCYRLHGLSHVCQKIVIAGHDDLDLRKQEEGFQGWISSEDCLQAARSQGQVLVQQVSRNGTKNSFVVGVPAHHHVQCDIIIIISHFLVLFLMQQR